MRDVLLPPPVVAPVHHHVPGAAAGHATSASISAGRVAFAERLTIIDRKHIKLWTLYCPSHFTGIRHANPSHKTQVLVL